MIAKDRRGKEWSNDEGRRRKLEQREREVELLVIFHMQVVVDLRMINYACVL